MDFEKNSDGSYLLSIWGDDAADCLELADIKELRDKAQAVLDAAGVA